MLVGQQVRQGVRINGAIAIEYIHIIEERIEPSGKRLYWTSVRINNSAFHRMVDADKYDMMFTPTALLKIKQHPRYKGENPHGLNNILQPKS
jgi:hypothetical protein